MNRERAASAVSGRARDVGSRTAPNGNPRPPRGHRAAEQQSRSRAATPPWVPGVATDKPVGDTPASGTAFVPISNYRTRGMLTASGGGRTDPAKAARSL
jgi:hypothetical protein